MRRNASCPRFHQRLAGPVLALCAALTLLVGACDDAEDAPTGRVAETIDRPPVLGTWHIRRLASMPDLAAAVPLELAAGPDGQITGTQPYSLDGEPPCGINTLSVSAVDNPTPPSDAATRRMLAGLPPGRSPAHTYAGRYTYACYRHGGQVVPIAIGFVPAGAAGEDGLVLCQPSWTGTAVCEDYVRAPGHREPAS